MKTVGIIGGMSWESTAKYYQWLNEGVRHNLGGLHSAKIILLSVDFQEIEMLQAHNQWEEAGRILSDAAKTLETAGVDFILLATNTMHKVANVIESAISIPFIHIADATAERIKASHIQKIGLLGTAYTMEQDFYKGRLSQNGITVSIPDEATRERVHAIIFEELCLGKINPESKKIFMNAVNAMISKGAEGVILGCTEISLLVNQDDFSFPVFDTTAIHVEKALEIMMSGNTP